MTERDLAVMMLVVELTGGNLDRELSEEELQRLRGTTPLVPSSPPESGGESQGVVEVGK